MPFGADAYGVVIEALVEDRDRVPVGAAVVQVAVGAVERCQLPVDPPERDGVGCLAADDLLDRVQGGGVGEPAGGAEEVVHDDGVAIVGLPAQGRAHVDGGSGAGHLNYTGYFAARGAPEAGRVGLPYPLPEPSHSRRSSLCLKPYDA